MARRWLRKNLLLALTILSVILGATFGFILRAVDVIEADSVASRLINFPGEIFMQILKMMILPLIISSLISAIAQLEFKESRQIGLMTIAYYLTTTFLAICTGIVLVLTIHPGNPTIKDDWKDHIINDDTEVSPLDTFLDLIRNMFPENIIQATFQRVHTKYVAEKSPMLKRIPNITLEIFLKKQQQKLEHIMRKKIEYDNGVNVLGIIVFCTGFGMIISKLGDRARLMVKFFIILDSVIMRFVALLMWCAPLGIMCLVCGNVIDVQNLSETAQVLFMYVLTVVCGLLIHSMFTGPLLYFAMTRKNPYVIVRGMLQALVTAFGTASGGAALPVSFSCLEENLGIDRRISRFVLPLGSTINMDGNALYEAVAVIFIAQLNNVSLSYSEVVAISVTATVASIGMGSVPAGLVTILLVLATVGLPAKDVALIITVDWLLDRIRTSINVLGDGFGAGIIQHLIGDRLKLTDLAREVHEDIGDLESRRSSLHITQISISGNSRRNSRLNSVGGRLSWRRAQFEPLLIPKIGLEPDVDL